ncbi:MAG: cytochrome c [Chitinophagaceae bacterium]
MYQSKHIVIAFLILFIGVVAFFSIQYFINRRPSNSPVIITENNTIDTSQAEKGKILFRACAPCHGIFKDLTGPLLAGVEKRWPDKKELFAFIKNPGVVMQRNAYAKKLKEKYISMMPAYRLTDKEIESILAYTRREENGRTGY